MIKKLKAHWVIVLLIAVFVCAMFLRVTRLSEFPVGFQIDEASLGYNAYSILTTGKSEAGVSLPLYIDTFGDNRPTGYNYIDIPAVAVFGLTIFATRLPGAFFGALSVFPIFLLAYLFYKNKTIGVVAAVFLCISPWSVVLGRASAETIVALFFILFGFYFLLYSVEKKSTVQLVSGTILLALSFFFYHTPRIFVPMFLFVSIVVLYFPYKNIWRNTQFLKLFGAFLVLSFVSFLLIFVIKGGTGRFSQVNIFTFPETRLVLEEQQREDGTFHSPLIETRALHNKLVNYPLTFASNYFAYFSGDFLFINGGLPIWYKVEKVGLILLIEFPFILYGAYLSIRSKNRLEKLPLFWVLVAPVTASITVDDIPNLQRAIVLFPMLEILAAVGLVSLLKRIFSLRYPIFNSYIKYIALICIVFAIAFNFSYFMHQYFVHGSTHRTWYRNNGFSEMMNLVNKNYNKYDKIVMTKTGGGYPLVLFFSGYAPDTYQREGSLKDKDYKGFGKYIFVPQDCPSINSSVNFPKKTKVLFVDMGTCASPNPKLGVKFDNIFKEDGTPAFRVMY